MEVLANLVVRLFLDVPLASLILIRPILSLLNAQPVIVVLISQFHELWMDTKRSASSPNALLTAP